MATENSALKIKVSTDASDVKKGLKKAADDVKSFEKTTTGALGSLADAFGVNVSKIQEMSSAFGGAAAKMAQSAGLSKSAILDISSAMSGVGLAAGAVVATVVAAWTQMNNAANHYLATLEGVAAAEGLKAWKDTYKNYLKDVTDGGEANAEAVIGMKKTLTKFGQAVTLVAKAGTGALGEKSIGQAMREANKNASEAEELQKQITEAVKRQLVLQPRILEIQAAINEDMATFRDTSATIVERQAALERIQDNIAKKYSLQRDDLKLIAENKAKINDLSSTTMKDLEGQVAAENAFVDLSVKEKAELAALVRYSNALKRGIGGAAGSSKELLEATKELVDLTNSMDLGGMMIFNRESFAELEQYASDAIDKVGHTFILDGKVIDNTTIVTQIGEVMDDVQDNIEEEDYEIEIPVDLQAKIDNWNQLSENIGSAVVDLGTDIATAFGDAIGGALSGDEGAWSDFGTDILSSLGNFATKLGGLLIGFGTAGLALESFISNPYTAIAAGVALVALGAGVKAAASNMAKGYSTYSSSTSYSGSNSSVSAGDYTERELNIKVSGSLVASGSSLVAVIENENNRKTKTT